MITAEKVGRQLHIRVEGFDEPYIVEPLPGRAGLQITEAYLNAIGSTSSVEDAVNAFVMALDGARYDEHTKKWVPVPPEEQHNTNRLGMELSASEQDLVQMPAFFWQTILGMDGVRAYIEGGEGLSGTLKAAGALAARLDRLNLLTSPRTASASPTRTGSSRTTSSPRGGKKNGKRR